MLSGDRGANLGGVPDPEALGFDPGRVFDGVAADYQAWRPGYPDALFDAIEVALGPLAGRRVLDVGAGTGISAAALAWRGATVVALDPSRAMSATLRRSLPELRVALGRAEALPVADGSIELVTCAQAWHWVRLPEAASEVRRALAPGGAAALWWNVSEDDGELFEALERELGIGRYGGRERQDDDASLLRIGGFAGVQRVSVRWPWTVPVEHWMHNVATRSVLAKLGPGAAGRQGAIEALVRRQFPGGEVTEWFTTRLVLVWP